MEDKGKNARYGEGRLPANAPLANPYVPFQIENPEKYEPRKALVRGTLFPGLDLPFMGLVNKQEQPVTPLTELQTMGFVIQELALYLNTHRDDQEALDMYHDLLTLKEPPMGILALIARQFNLMLQVKELQQKGLGGRQIADKVGLAPFIVQKYERQASRFKMKELKTALQACVEADEAVKTGKLNDVLSVELLIIERSR